MALAVEDLLAVPDLPLKIDAARIALGYEATRREKFRDGIEPHEKGEFINGEIFMHSPARHCHNRVSSLITSILAPYCRVKSCGFIVYEKALCGFSRNDYEPDIAWFSPEKAAGITGDTVVYPIPDFIIEILSPETAQRDRGVKLDDYAAHGVREYWIVDADARTIEQYLLADENGVYRLAEKLAHGDINPASFPELHLPLAACFEETANLEFLRQLLNA
jgi:Uma2 family endonuclease